MNGIDLITNERTRQIESEGYSVPEDFRKYRNDELIRAAVVYAMPFDIREAELSPCTEGSNHAAAITTFKKLLWPWEEKWWKPSADRKKDLVKAGALIAAELDRIRLAETGTIPEPILKLAEGGFVSPPGMAKMTRIAQLILELTPEDFKEVRGDENNALQHAVEYKIVLATRLKHLQTMIKMQSYLAKKE